ATKLPGVHFSEHLKNTAAVADKLAVVRSMTHGEAAHERGTHNMFTGYRPSTVLTYPSFGSMVSHELGPRENLPPYVCIPNEPTPYAGTGYLGPSFGPFSLGSDPARGDFAVRDLALPNGVDAKRFAQRQRLRAIVDEHFSNMEKSDVLDGMDTFYQRAYSMISSEKARAAFSINDEPAKLRDAYGRNEAGQRMLLARRLIEAGVRVVCLSYGGWDHHDNIKNGIAGGLPVFDQAFAALINDLDSRGLLATTLVTVTTEFGRTPKINATGGRDHWPKVFSIVMAGAGLKRGIVYGSSDATAAEPENNPLTVEDYAFTIYNQLGIDPDKALLALGNRPTRIVYGGKVAKELVA
ncbi:MAG: DUF1501 domain-containing protein, partial [Verrucomicrobia bacterium]|nr:DUF1501 domain-containing protein [Verrucomicrobiota bacterium]